MTPRKPRKTLDGTLAAQIRDERRSGASYEAIQTKFGISAGTVRKALAMPEPAPAAESEPTVEALTSVGIVDDVSGDLCVIDGLARQAAKDKNLSGVATLGRLRVALLEHRRKANRPDPATEGKILVDKEEFTIAATRVRRRWQDLLEKYRGLSPAHALAGMILMGESIKARSPRYA